VKARTVLKTGEETALRGEIAALEAKLAQRDDAKLAAWEQREQARLAARGRDLRVIPLKAVKISTPNRGAGFDVTPEGRVRLRNPGDLGAFDILAELPKNAGPITGLRFVMHPVDDAALGGWGYGPRAGRPRARPPRRTARKWRRHPSPPRRARSN
jgi:hypothetical protein